MQASFKYLNSFVCGNPNQPYLFSTVVEVSHGVSGEVHAMGDTLGQKNQGDRPVWEDPDPRVKWALDLFDNQGYETTPYTTKFFYPAVFGAVAGSMGPLNNLLTRRPVTAGMPMTVGLFAVGAFIGRFIHERRASRMAEKEAVAKHYIMLHPDRFPEPEMKKWGDKCVLLPWAPNRGF